MRLKAKRWNRTKVDSRLVCYPSTTSAPSSYLSKSNFAAHMLSMTAREPLLALQPRASYRVYSAFLVLLGNRDRCPVKGGGDDELEEWHSLR